MAYFLIRVGAGASCFNWLAILSNFTLSMLIIMHTIWLELIVILNTALDAFGIDT
jgi:hypothetical protein